MPLLASPQAGAGCVIKKISRSILSDADGVVYHGSFGGPPLLGLHQLLGESQTNMKQRGTPLRHHSRRGKDA